jgi:tetratricopeptide (TPR) repeat protein
MRASLLHRAGVLGALTAFAVGASADANAQSSRPQFHWPWERPSYRSAPSQRPAASPRRTPRQEDEPSTQATESYRSSTSTPSTETDRSSQSTPSTDSYRSSPGTTETYRSMPTSAPAQAQALPLRPAAQAQPAVRPQPAAQPVAALSPRTVQGVQNDAQYVQLATACMNEKKSLAADKVVQSCDAVIDDTIRNLANAYYFRGSATLSQRDFDGAIASYTQAIKLDPTQSEFLTGRASAYEAKKDFDRAMADYNQAIKVDPKSAHAYNNRGAAYQRKGDYARAAADYGEVTRLQPNNLDAWSARCWVRAVSPGQTQQALNDCNQALKIKQESPDVLDTRGFIHLKLGQSDNAIKDFDAALRYDPKLAGSLYGRGLAKIKKGERDAGNDDIAAAKAIKSDIAEEFSRYGVR